MRYVYANHVFLVSFSRFIQLVYILQVTFCAIYLSQAARLVVSPSPNADAREPPWASLHQALTEPVRYVIEAHNGGLDVAS
jgi:hypothetical protein